jgi:multiple sugar transport system substrate-binding protein
VAEGCGVIRLRGMAFDHPRNVGPLRASAREYERRHPEVEVSWDARSLKDFEEHPIEKLTDRYDLVVIDHPFVGTGVEKGVLVPLDEYAPDEYLTDQRQNSVGPSYESYSWQDHQWALAIDAAAQVSAYRPDLLGQMGFQTPRTWEEVLDLADALPSGTRMGLPLNPTHSYCTFVSLCANLAGRCPWDEAGGADWSAAEEALAYLNKLAQAAHGACLELDPIQLLNMMSRSEEVAYSPFLFGYCSYALPGFAPHLVRFTNIPSSKSEPTGSILGGVGLAVSARSEHKQAAVDYALSVASADFQKGLYFESGGQPGYRGAWISPEINDRSSGFFQDTLRALDLAYMRPRHAGYPAFQQRAGDLVHRFLRNGASGRETVNGLMRLYEKTRTIIGELG